MLVAQLLNGLFTPRNLSEVRGKTLLTILLNYLGYNKIELFLVLCVPLRLRGRSEILLNSKCNENDTFEETSTHIISIRKCSTLRM